MRRNVKIVKLIFLLVLVGMMGVFFVNRAIGQKFIKASNDLVQQDFQLTVSNKWNDEKASNYTELIWKEPADIESSGYQLYRSEDGKSWNKLSLSDSKTSEESNSSKKEARYLENKVIDDSVKDDVPPKVPNIAVENIKDNKLAIEVFSEDEGKSYQWYVASDTTSAGTQKSDVMKEEITSGLKGYIYVVDNSATTVPIIDRNFSGEVTNIDISVGATEYNTTVSGIDRENKTWIHIMAVDRANNVSDVKHTELRNDEEKVELKDANRYIDFNIERTADLAKLVDISLGSSLNGKMKSFEIKIPKNMEIKDYDKLVLPTSWYKFQNSDDEDFRSFTLAMNNNNNLTTIKNFLEALQFTIKSAANKKGNIEIVFHELIYTSWESPDGKIHYYTFVPTPYTWLEAYNLAKKMRYRGLTGYLATLTSSEEHNFVYTNIAKQSGWLGGGRLAKSNGEKLNDESAISENVADYIIRGASAQQWYWVNGPEKRLVFFDKPTFKEGGKAPGGVYQGFNNPAAGGTASEPNNSGDEFILEFAQASAVNPTKMWNDLSYRRTTYNTGYYVEFSEYGSQVETEEETDVSAIREIPQKISVRAVDENGAPMTSGNIQLDQQLKIGKKETIVPENFDMYDFIKLVDTVENQISPLEYTISSTFQEGKLIYASRKLTVHARQVVLDKNAQVVLPKKGFGVLETKTEIGERKNEFPLTTVSTDNNKASFNTYIIRYQRNESNYTFIPQIPMNYKLAGYVLTTTNQQHIPDNSSLVPVQIDVSKNSEFWLTTYIKPTTVQPTFYHWEYKENKLGTIMTQ
ncbi:hypothetical protein A5819_000654 [Enterococcus sp. 7E2_DIV0204]|uniref:hypothetical protein n=1 Tax=unclassified Enterococcus TaxID=2608891 RepID=UPI000B62D52A|nr:MULTISPECIES: hypothetical protein [unclassified Enterococcus]OTN88202.1 hypothetical protein A5819_000654 [Enterococcus sp. 7E2_DIV0204]OTP49119.1 hypothetical protein A5884_002313 [Enterococcus sp. 7D2_DIV0200]